MNLPRLRLLTASLLLGLACVVPSAGAERIKDLASIGGVRSNALVGYGLVVGLDNSGDRTSQAQFTVQSLKNMLGELGVNLPPGVNPQLKNVAAVAIHAELPPFAKPGQTIDITVSSVGNAVSLRGGSLLMAPLKGADGQVYAIAQGNLVVGGFGAEGRDGSRVSVNIPSVGRIPNGATVERALPDVFAGANELSVNLHSNDFTTVSRMVARSTPASAKAWPVRWMAAAWPCAARWTVARGSRCWPNWKTSNSPPAAHRPRSWSMHVPAR
jgi:Flagellar basal-body P-ring protein